MSGTILDIRDLRLSYRAHGARVQALRGVSLSVRQGEVLGIAGESGCGKSTLATAMIGLVAAGADITAGSVTLAGHDLVAMGESQRRRLRGKDVAMVFQDPMTAFNPVLTIGAQLVDFQHNLERASAAAKRGRAVEMLARVGISDPEATMRRYPHELSGGMRQRAAIAAALLMRPKVLIADEPTTALDVTMEAQIIHLLRGLQAEEGCAIVVVTHHLGVIAELCDRVAVMYAGEVVEEAPVDDFYHAPGHPYSRALLACDPSVLDTTTGRLPAIGGRPPDLAEPPPGCAFAARCALATDRCRAEPPPRVTLRPGQTVLCHEARP